MTLYSKVIKIEKREANQYSPLTLAFLGDAVYEQLVRERIVRTANMPAHKLHDLSVKHVRAAYQSRAYDIISEIITEDEADILRRGRNASGNSHNVPKSSDHTEYSRATAVEALFGWLRLTENYDRINIIFDHIWERTPTENEQKE